MKKLSLDQLNRVSIEVFKTQEKAPAVLILDNIRSLNNVGSAFRTADAFAIEKIFLCGITGKPPHRDIQKTALGATESVSWEFFEKIDTCLAHLKNEEFTIIAVEQTDSSIELQDFKVALSKKYAFVVGNEVQGISEKALPFCDFSLEIPQFGTKHSLNVSVSLGIVLWEFIRQRNA